MDILHSAYYSFLRNLRDKKSLAMMLVLPIVIIFILGSAVKGLFELKNISKTEVAYLNLDQGAEGARLDGVLSGMDMGELIAVEKVSSEKEGLQLVKDVPVV